MVEEYRPGLTLEQVDRADQAREEQRRLQLVDGTGQ
jgi:hypothetical protein